MQNIPFFEKYDPKTRHLTLRGATHVPEEVFQFAEEIEILDVSNGSLTLLPNDLPRLKNLRILFGSNNPFEKVPEVLSKCPNLYMVGFKSCQISQFAEHALPPSVQWLILTDNKLKQLPASMGELVKLRKVSLAGNQLSALPNEMQKCRDIEFLRIAANNFQGAPSSWVFELPKLAWYGDSGNPFSLKSNSESLLPSVSWNDIEIGELLGDSPSSEVFKGILKDTKQEVAVKLYRGELTSDGYPVDDMHAALAAGAHDNLVQILGRLVSGPDNKQGLVLSLIPSEYTSLGLPPDLDSCSRDTYSPDSQFSLATVQNILRGIASAGAHLHSKGIAHGDLYAHNILTNDEGYSFLGDFGAAAFYDPSVRDNREKLDVRAFGYLMEELLQRTEQNSDQKNIEKLQDLKQSCLDEKSSLRPSFGDIAKRI